MFEFGSKFGPTKISESQRGKGLAVLRSFAALPLCEIYDEKYRAMVKSADASTRNLRTEPLAPIAVDLVLCSD